MTSKGDYIEDLLKEANVTVSGRTWVPGVRNPPGLEDEAIGLSPEAHSSYRRLVGKLMWLGPIRPDLQFSIKELARCLTSPTIRDEKRLIHLLRYLKATKSYEIVLGGLQNYRIGQDIGLEARVDSDWAGCSRTRKSTSRGLYGSWAQR